MSTDSRKRKPSRERLERIEGVVRSIGKQSALTRRVVAGALGLHPTDFAGVDFLHSCGGACSVGELSKATGLTSGSTTALIDRLEKEGYAVREPDPSDRRRQIVRMREGARDRCEAVYTPIRAALIRLWSGYTEQELRLVEDFITRTIELHARCLERFPAAADSRPAAVPERAARRSGDH